MVYKLRKNKVAVTKLQILLLAGIVIVAGIAGGYYYLTTSQERPKMVVATWGASYENATRAATDRFSEEYGVDVEFYLQGGALQTISKLRAEIDAPTIDLVLTSPPGAWTAAEEHLAIEIPEDKVPYIEDMQAPSLTLSRFNGSLYFVPVWTNTVGLIVNLDRVETEVTSYKWLWSNDLYPRKLMIPSIVQANGLMTLVLPAYVWGGDEYDVDLGFEKLKELCPNIGIVYKTTGDALNAMVTGEVDASITFAVDAYNAYKQGANISFTKPDDAPIFSYWNYVFAVKNGPLARGGREDLLWAAMNMFLNPEVQESYPKILATTPSNKNTKLPPELAGWLLTADDWAVAKTPDWGYLSRNINDWMDRFETEIVPLIGTQ